MVGLVRGVTRGERMLDEIAAELGGHDAPILDYARLRATISERERAQSRASRLQRRKAANDALAALRRGDIITITQGRRGGLAVVLEAARDSDDPRPLVLTEHRWAGRISSADYSGASAPVGSMSLPKRVEHRQPRVRRDLASALRSAAAGLATPSAKAKRGGAPERDVDPELATLREQLRHHPAHHLPDREAKIRLAERYLRIERDNAQIQQKVAAATNSLARTFDRIVVLLTERGFIDGDGGDPKVTDDGRLLARIYSESDLLVAECLRSGAWNGLEPAELAAVLSAVLYESRGDAPGAPGRRRADRQVATRAEPDPQDLGRPARRRAAAPDHRQPRTRRRFRRRHLPLGHHRRPDRRAGRIRRGRYRFAGRWSYVRRRFRAVVPPGSRPARPGPQRRTHARPAGRGETRHQRHSARRRRC